MFIIYLISNDMLSTIHEGDNKGLSSLQLLRNALDIAITTQVR